MIPNYLVILKNPTVESSTELVKIKDNWTLSEILSHQVQSRIWESLMGLMQAAPGTSTWELLTHKMQTIQFGI